MNKLMNLSLASAAAAALVLGSAGASHAASESCTTSFGLATCTTDWIHANATNHFVHVSVGPWQTYSVHDIDTHVRVAHGTNGILGTSRTITGLYGRYNASITNMLTSAITGSRITISNT